MAKQIENKERRIIEFKPGEPLENISYDDILKINGVEELVIGDSLECVETLRRENNEILNLVYHKQKLLRGEIDLVSCHNYGQDRNYDRILKGVGL